MNLSSDSLRYIIEIALFAHLSRLYLFVDLRRTLISLAELCHVKLSLLLSVHHLWMAKATTALGISEGSRIRSGLLVVMRGAKAMIVLLIRIWLSHLLRSIAKLLLLVIWIKALMRDLRLLSVSILLLLLLVSRVLLVATTILSRISVARALVVWVHKLKLL